MITSKLPKVSICVAYFNRSEQIKDSIGSLLSQTYENYEIIVVNDGSSDPLVKKYLSEFKDSRLTVINQNNQGFVKAITKAIAESNGEYIAIHGAGDLSRKTRLSEQANFLTNNPDYALVSCNYTDVIVDCGVKGESTPFNLYKGEVFERDLTYGPSPIGHGEIMYRRSAYESAGGYRDFFTYAQDKDLWLRMIHYGRFYILPNNLYERGLFVQDGIATDYDKLYLQKLLMSLALQCYELRKTNKKDLVDTYGHLAGLYRAKSKRVANYCHTTSYRLLMNNDYSGALKFNALSMSEWKMIKSTLMLVLLYFCNVEGIRTKVIRVMQKMRSFKLKNFRRKYM